MKLSPERRPRSYKTLNIIHTSCMGLWKIGSRATRTDNDIRKPNYFQPGLNGPPAPSVSTGMSRLLVPSNLTGFRGRGGASMFCHISHLRKIRRRKPREQTPARPGTDIHAWAAQSWMPDGTEEHPSAISTLYPIHCDLSYIDGT